MKAPARSAPARDLSLITREQLVTNHFRTAYDAVVALHSNWLHSRHPDALRRGVQVYFNNIRLGGIETLQSINIQNVSYIRHHDALAASALFGSNHSAGVIYVATHPVVTGVGLRR